VNTLVDIPPEQIKIVIDDPKKAVNLVRSLLWAESRKQGVNPLSIHISEQIYTKDGGIDARLSILLLLKRVYYLKEQHIIK